MLDEIRQLATAYSLVSLMVIPLAIALRVLTRSPVLPPPRLRGNRWMGTDVIAWLLVCMIVPLFISQLAAQLAPAAPDADVIDHEHRIRAASGVVVIPLLAFGFAFWRHRINTESPRRHALATDITAGILTWAVITPIVLTIHFATNAVARELGYPPDEHPLKQSKLDTPLRVLLFLFGACVVGPFIEELMFRRVLVPWSVRRLERAWIVMLLAAMLAFATVPVTRQPHAMLFLGAIGVPLLLLTFAVPRRKRWPLRTIAGLLATSALFAVAHASVWPTPIPLLVLAFALGWLMRRTGTVTAVTITHGLFNLVSSIALIRGA